MASFLDSPNLSVSEYISPVDLDVYGTVIKERQDLYNQGVQKVQAGAETIGGIQVAKPAHKNYLRNAVSSMQSDLNRLAGEDFSKQSVVNQALGMASKVARDPIIQNAMQSTLRMQEESKRIEDYKKSGKVSPSNDYVYQKQLNDWLNDGDEASSFNASYTPFTDVMGEFLKVYKELHPTSTLTQNDFIAEGSSIRLTNEALTKGIKPETITSAWGLVSSRPDVQKQLGIDGQFYYRDFDDNTLKGILSANSEENVRSINNQIAELKQKQTVDKTAGAEATNYNISQLERVGKAYEDEFKRLNSLSGESLRASLYGTQYGNNLKNTLSYSETSSKVTESAFQKALNDDLNYKLKLQQFELDRYKASRQTRSSSSSTQTGEGGEEMPDTQAVTKNVSTATVQNLGQSSYMAMYDNMNVAYRQAVRKNIATMAAASNQLSPWRKDPKTQQYIPNVGHGGYADERSATIANNQMYANAEIAYRDGKATPQVNAMFQEIEPLYRNLDALATTARNINQRYEVGDNFYDKRLGNFNVRLEVDERGEAVAPFSDNSFISAGEHSILFAPRKTSIKNISLTPSELKDLYAAKEGSGTISKDAANNLKAKFGDWGYKALLNASLGVNKNLYNNVKSNLDAMGYLNVRERVEEDFKTAQTQRTTTQVNFINNNANDNKQTAQRYQTIIGNIPPQDMKDSDKGIYQEALDLIKKDTEGNSNLYGYNFDWATNTPYLTIEPRGDISKRVEVPISAADATIPGMVVSSDFMRMHGSVLDVTGGTNTDVRNNGLNAFNVHKPANSKYTVRYHLFGPGDNSFLMKLYVWDQQGNKIFDGYPYSMNPAGSYMSQEEIMGAVNFLKDDKTIDLIRENQQ